MIILFLLAWPGIGHARPDTEFVLSNRVLWIILPTIPGQYKPN